MDIFTFRHRRPEYAQYVGRFNRVAAPDVKATVDAAFEDQQLWPQPIVQLNPAFEPGAYVSELVTQGVLHETSGPAVRSRRRRRLVRMEIP
ncbi:MAG: hypothetical protein H0U69_05580 [Trueperaceae bacterium]|nr:hypothetical protein [Trueperaceae bacterium]